jgi:hypothetical protein
MRACSTFVSWYSSTSTWSYSPAIVAPELGRGLEQRRPEEEQVVVVDEVARRLARRVVAEHREHLRLVLGELRMVVEQDAADVDLGVDVARVDALQRLLLGKRAFAARPAPRLGSASPSAARDSCIRSSASPWSRIVKSAAIPAAGP